jgi:hypothetical protein
MDRKKSRAHLQQRVEVHVRAERLRPLSQRGPGLRGMRGARLAVWHKRNGREQMSALPQQIMERVAVDQTEFRIEEDVFGHPFRLLKGQRL